MLLKNTQEVFWNLIVAPEGVEEGLKTNPSIHLESWFKGDSKLPAVRRLNIYANMYFWRIHDAIKEDFPVLFKVIGEKNWNNLMVDYILKHPSSSPLLQYVGGDLVSFLSTYFLTEQWPFLPDLAKLEWERAMIFEAKDSPTIHLERLKKIPAAQWPPLKIQWIPALKIVELGSEVDQTWKEAERNETLTKPKKKKTVVRVWRQDFIIYHQQISKEERQAIQSFEEGNNFAFVCEELQSAKKAATFLQDWVTSGLVAKVHCD